MVQSAKDRIRNNISEPFDRACAGHVLPERNVSSQRSAPQPITRTVFAKHEPARDNILNEGVNRSLPVDSRKVAVATAGFCTFLTLYSPQALLPALSREFGVGAAEISTIMTASTLAIALTAPFTGAIADVLGRKRVIAAAMLAVVVPMAGAALAPDVQVLIAWRFFQGLLLPPIFAVTVAYIGDEWPPASVAGVAGIYIAGSSLGGFCGRFIPGVLGDLIGWRGAFLALAGLSLVGAVMVMLLLPREKGFVRSHGLSASAWQMLRHLKNPQLLATYGIGFGVLFNFIAVFTYVSFHLAGRRTTFPRRCSARFS
jgi:MFS transporter, YNFM family, putative membrane transport protein